MSTTTKPRPKQDAPASRPRQDNWRETVESVVVAFVLAFLIRAFEAEAFVIPTGSMAPTLMGRHKDVTCDECGFRFRVGIGEHDSDEEALETVCPNCRNLNLTAGRSHNGDRILVLKFPYAFSEPERWDVSVFHYPEAAGQNYIKRLVGIGPEQVRLYGGDAYRRRLGTSDWQIIRKPLVKQQVLQMLVYDNEHLPQALGAAWQRWRAAEPGGWTERDGRVFECRPSQRPVRLQYRHLVPDFQDWADGEAEQAVPHLITDYYAYNASERTAPLSSVADHWVGDLTVSFDVELVSPGGELVCELNEGIGSYLCRFDLGSGKVTLEQRFWREDGAALFGERTLAQAETPLKGTGTHHVTFANVDDRLVLWINGDAIPFANGRSGGVTYRPPHLERLALRLLADHPAAREVLVLSPQSSADATAQAAQHRLKDVLDVFGGPDARLVTYAPGDQLDHVLRTFEGAPIVLLGDGPQKHAFLEDHDELLAREPRRFYALGVDSSPHDIPRHSSRLRVVHPSPTRRDLVPVEITATGAQVRLGRLRLDRDVYYVASSQRDPGGDDYGRSGFLDDPQRWSEAFDALRDAVFDLEQGQYLMLGDNSPRSKDSRLWNDGPEVVEKLLIGRAFFIYWPHGKPLLGLTKAPAVWPNFARMRFIR